MPTTHTTPIDLRGFHGREFEGVLRISNGDIHCKGIISVNNENVYLCQNDILGTPIPDRFGYKYSWRVQDFNEQVYDGNLKSITILDQPSSIDPRWDWKDGEEVHYDAERKKVCRIHKDIVVFISNGNATGCYTNEEAYKTGYRKLPSPPNRTLTEITEEMFDKTNLIGRKVMYDEKEGQVLGMFIHPDESRSITIRGMVGSFTISQCKLIEE